MPYRQYIARANNANLADYLPLWIRQEPIGLIQKTNIARLQHYGLALERTVQGIIWHDLQDFTANSQQLHQIFSRMAQDGHLTGWRDEPFALAQHLHAPPHALIERAALPYLGICGYGVHLNGLTLRNGKLHMWLGKRAANKSTHPNQLDQIAAGGLPYGISVFDNLLKESQEEAGIPATLAQQAKAVSIVSYLHQTDIGIRADITFNYDLWLPEAFTPQNQDGEVAEFLCLPIEEIIEILHKPERIKFNAALVIIDSLVRLGYLSAKHPDYQYICSNLNPRDNLLNAWIATFN